MIVGLDPGGTTGFAEFEGGRWNRGQIAPDEVWAYLTSFHRPPKVLVVEKFTYRRAPHVDLTPAEVIGVIKECASQHDLPIEWQTPSQAKFYFTNARIRELGLWIPGKPHAMDATRHLLYYMEFGGGKDEGYRYRGNQEDSSL